MRMAASRHYGRMQIKDLHMSIRKTIGVITQLAAQGAIKNYAIAGAVAALNYSA